jgi:hypothetical protein
VQRFSLAPHLHADSRPTSARARIRRAADPGSAAGGGRCDGSFSPVLPTVHAAVLKALSDAAPSPVAPEALAEAASRLGPSTLTPDRIADVIRGLRVGLGASSPVRIETVRGIGFRLVDAPPEGSAPLP